MSEGKYSNDVGAAHYGKIVSSRPITDDVVTMLNIFIGI